MKTKQLTHVEIKDETQGTVEAVFSTFNTVDSDKDVTLPGAFTEGAPTRISAYGHTSWHDLGGRLPVGKGTIRTNETEAILEGRFFLNTALGRDTFEVVKEMGDLQEWSYGYDPIKFSFGEFEGERVRFLEKLGVDEVSPVLKGAGINTRTISTKQLSSDLSRALRDAGKERFGSEDTWVWLDDVELDDSWAVYAIEPEDGESRLIRVDYSRNDDGTVTLAEAETDVQRVTNYAPKAGDMKLSEQIETVMTGLDRLTTRLGEVVTLRASNGKALGASTRKALEQLAERHTRLQEVLTSPTATNQDTDELAKREYARFVAITQGVQI